MDGRIELYRIFVGKTDGKSPLGRPRHRWEDNSKMDVQKVTSGYDWIKLAQDRHRWQALENEVVNLCVL